MFISKKNDSVETIYGWFFIGTDRKLMNFQKKNDPFEIDFFSSSSTSPWSEEHYYY